MKKILLVILALTLLLTACAQQKEDAAPSAETPAAEAPAAPEAPAETPLVQETPAEAPASPKEETKTETPAEVPKPEAAKEKGQTYEVTIGDEVKYNGITFKVEDIKNNGNQLYLNFDPYILRINGLNKPEILSDIEFTITDNTKFMSDHSVALNVKPLVLGKDEYFLEFKEIVKIGNYTLELGEVKYDQGGYDSAYFITNEKQYWARLGTPVTAEKLEVTLLKAFYRQRQYAILKIVPA